MVKVKYVAAGVGILLVAVLLAYGTLFVSEHSALKVSNTGSNSELMRVPITPGEFETPDRSFVTVLETALMIRTR